MEEKLIYVVESYGGDWEDVECVCSSSDKAEKFIKEYCSLFDVTNLPMTLEEYEKANYGYPDEEDAEELVDRDGHTVEDFLKMQEFDRLTYLDLTGLMVLVCVLDGPIKEIQWYNKKGERTKLKNI
jgi:hypothetical protein